MADPKKERIFQVVNFGAVLVASILAGVVIMQMYMKGRQEVPAAAGASATPAPPSAAAPTTQAVTPPPGSTPVFEKDITMTMPQPPVELSQRAKVLATEFFCLCTDNCGLVLLDCNCTKGGPGQREMKQFLQALVDQDKKSDEIREAMIAKYGPSVKIP